MYVDGMHELIEIEKIIIVKLYRKHIWYQYLIDLFLLSNCK